MYKLTELEEDILLASYYIDQIQDDTPYLRPGAKTISSFLYGNEKSKHYYSFKSQFALYGKYHNRPYILYKVNDLCYQLANRGLLNKVASEQKGMSVPLFYITKNAVIREILEKREKEEKGIQETFPLTTDELLNIDAEEEDEVQQPVKPIVPEPSKPAFTVKTNYADIPVSKPQNKVLPSNVFIRKRQKEDRDMIGELLLQIQSEHKNFISRITPSDIIYGSKNEELEFCPIRIVKIKNICYFIMHTESIKLKCPINEETLPLIKQSIKTKSWEDSL